MHHLATSVPSNGLVVAARLEREPDAAGVGAATLPRDRYPAPAQPKKRARAIGPALPTMPAPCSTSWLFDFYPYLCDNIAVRTWIGQGGR